MLRETESLSAVGLSKANIEMQLLRTLQQGYTVAFIFYAIWLIKCNLFSITTRNALLLEQ